MRKKDCGYVCVRERDRVINQCWLSAWKYLKMAAAAAACPARDWEHQQDQLWRKNRSNFFSAALNENQATFLKKSTFKNVFGLAQFKQTSSLLNVKVYLIELCSNCSAIKISENISEGTTKKNPSR